MTGIMAGFLEIRNAELSSCLPELAVLREELERELRNNYSGMQRNNIKNISEIKIYSDYYKTFKKTYHVLLQLESVALKGKSIPEAPPFVQIMFMAELKNLLLTAVHDMTKISLPVTVHAASGEETYKTMGGKEQTLKRGDIFMADQEGIISSIIYGPDERTQVTFNTTQALYTVYVPKGISSQYATNHLVYIREMVTGLSPYCKVGTMEILT